MALFNKTIDFNGIEIEVLGSVYTPTIDVTINEIKAQGHNIMDSFSYDALSEINNDIYSILRDEIE